MTDSNRGSADRKPVIAFSQNFDVELIAKVGEAGAFPIQKDYTKNGQRIWGAAIRLLADPVQGPLLERRAAEVTVRQLFKLLGSLSLVQFWSFMCAIGTIVAGIFYLGSVFGKHGWR
jgi:hypothetical protein